MEVEIQSQQENPLLHRLEVRFVVRGEGATPTREAIRDALAAELKLKDKTLILDHVKPAFGTTAAQGYAKVYDSAEDARRVERKHILERNNLAEGTG